MISAVVVSYRSGALARRAVETLRAAAGESIEAIAVVNSGDESEAALLTEVFERVLTPPRNLGYAGGLNLGAASATGDVLLLANPDLVFRAGSVGPLVAAASEPRVAAGPAFFLDESETLHLPPFEPPSPHALLRRMLASRDGASERLFRREARRSIRNARDAEAGRSVEARALSGGLVAVSRDTLRRVGPFDEGFALYFEENDWQKRLLALGGRMVRVGASRVVHPFGRSAALEPRAAGWFAASERRYFALHHGKQGVETLERALAVEAEAEGRELETLPGNALRFEAGASSRVAVAVSPQPSFRAHALALLPAGATSWNAPRELATGVGGSSWLARAFEVESARVLAEGRIASGASA